jgi:hypothetical protein
LIPPTVAEVRRLISAMRGPEEQREFRLGWSLFRRAHQAVAKRSHKATQSNKHATIEYMHLIEQDGCRRRGDPDPTDPSEDVTPKMAVHVKKGGLLADVEWERVRVLLPKHKPGLGRPRRDDRQVLCGILWIMETGASWQDLPEEEFGPTSTVRGRYRKWLKEGLWSQIVEALGR